ncbi:aminotransferase class V-fold PLP-dependent enzyme [Steroidobacter sp. S1-65]|uniref:Aminotransferase class V-fold PLP-dependent enzyme n=1 Tax=Steroidobacter gossypii TaxID=2805490 RepID=A0ABS1WU54_9GAMM|nr:aminotransferase class V-fold PLP-dependent enzyme [Steroidobacter gossypii]MBM0104506.1 aminotransferase class V-fold PLP-dependent enzyme [Steroidobacter gossypii]
MNDSTARLTRRDLLATSLMTSLGAAALGAASSAGAQPIGSMPSTTKELWQWFRTQPVLDLQRTYLDVAGAGPTLRAAMATEYRVRDSQSLNIAAFADGQWSAETTRIATAFGGFIGCDADEIMFTRGTGEAIATVANGLDLNAGDEILTTTREHPATLSPWLLLARRRGIVVKQIDLPAPMEGPEQALGLFAGAVTDRTRVLLFSHVQYADGTLMPVQDLCQFARQRNLISVVDGAQALGMLDFQLRDLGCDFYGTSFHKWLGGSNGTGMLYVRRDMLDRIWPSQPRGIDASPPVITPTQSKGHMGVPAALHKLGNIVPLTWPSLRGAEVALDFHRQVLRSRIEARIRELTIYARLRLQQLPGLDLLTPGRPGLWAGILSFHVPGRQASDITLGLVRGHRVFARDMQWPGKSEGAVRISLHAFNTHDEVDRLFNGLQQVLR